tara:strand:+ start:32069 stop:32209 length:141 start_codon:yes stop_codon:yes gene_type:complete
MSGYLKGGIIRGMAEKRDGCPNVTANYSKKNDCSEKGRCSRYTEPD